MRRMLRMAALSVFALSTVLIASCDSAERVTAPDQDYQVQAVRTSPYRMIGGTNNITRMVDGEYTTTNANDKLLVITHGGQVVSALYVEPGAAKPGTKFTMKLVSEPATTTSPGKFQIDLTATSPGSNVINDAGAKGFKKPVLLFINISYLNPTGLSLANLKVAELKVNNTVVPTRSWIVSENGTTWLVGQLAHFSGWVPIQD